MSDLLSRLWDAQVASCSCLTKTPDVDHHAPNCHYRLFNEAHRSLEEYDDVLRSIASYLGNGGYNSEGLIDPKQAHGKIIDGLDFIIRVEKQRIIDGYRKKIGEALTFGVNEAQDPVDVMLAFFHSVCDQRDELRREVKRLRCTCKPDELPDAGCPIHGGV